MEGRGDLLRRASAQHVTRHLPLSGWAFVSPAMAGLAIGGSYLVIGDTLPAFVYLPTAAVGLAILFSSR